jgi:hypothetical protein
MGIISIGTASEYRAFKDTQGRVIEAKLIRYDATKKTVQVERKGKRGSITVPVNIFSSADQEYIVAWDQNQIFLSDRFLTIDANRIKKKDESAPSFGSMATTYYAYCYNVKLNNKSKTPFTDIKIKYVIYYSQEHHINHKSDKEERFGTYFGEGAVDLPSRTEKEFMTEPIFLMDYRESGYEEVWPDLDGEIEGVILKISSKTDAGDEITREFRHPEKFSKPWITKTKNVQPKR